MLAGRGAGSRWLPLVLGAIVGAIVTIGASSQASSDDAHESLDLSLSDAPQGTSWAPRALLVSDDSSSTWVTLLNDGDSVPELHLRFTRESSP